MVTAYEAVDVDPPHPFATTTTLALPVNEELQVTTPAEVIAPADVGDNDHVYEVALGAVAEYVPVPAREQAEAGPEGVETCPTAGLIITDVDAVLVAPRHPLATTVTVAVPE